MGFFQGGAAGIRLIARFLLFSLVFCCFPIAVGGGFLYYTLLLEEESRRADSKQTLDHEAGVLLRRTDPQVYLQARLGNFIRAVFDKGNPIERLEKLRQRILPRWDVKFDPCLFDDGGKLITPGTIPLKNRFIVQKLYDCLLASPFESEKEFQKHRRKIAALFGSGFQLGIVKTRENQISFFRVGGTDGALIWKRASAAGKNGMILIAWRIPTREFLLEKYSRTEFKNLWLMSSDPGTGMKAFGRPVSPPFETAETSFTLSRNPYLWLEPFLWKSTFAENLRLYVGKPAPHANLEWLRILVLALAALLMVVAPVLLYRWFFAGDQVYLSIRLKLIGLFLLVMGFPLMGVAFLGSQTLKDRENVLVTQTIKEAKTLLSTLDADFSHETVDFARLCRQLRDDPEMKKTPEKIKNMTDRLQQEQRILHFEARTVSGDILAKTFITGYFEGLEEFFDSFGKFCIMRNLAGRLKASGGKINHPPDQVIQTLLESPYLGVLHIVTRGDVVHQTQLGVNHFFWYWDVIGDPGHPAAYMTVLQSMEAAFRQFLARKVHPLKEQMGREFLVLAREDQSGRWFPEDQPVPPPFETLMDRARIAQDSILERLNFNGKTYVAMGMPGKTLRGIGLLALFPEERILGKIGTLRWSISLGIFLTLLFAVLVAIVLSRTFLQPLADLSSGMRALQARDTKFRVPQRQNDELGALGQAFNRMMEDLKEMALAAVVQESLIPQKLPSLPGYEMKLGNTPATQLGGDYCDVIELKTGQFLFVVGDVTGHGVGAALLMAMVKAAVFDFFERRDDLIELMHHLNRMVLQLMKRQILMTFSALLLDPATGRFKFSNAGHPFPLQCRNHGSVEELELHHLPLGFQDKAGSFKILEGGLQPGETVAMFTDGYYESTNGRGEMFSYERVGSLLKEIAGLPASEMYGRMMDSLRKFRPNPVLEDDCTILILKRKGEPRQGA